MVRKADHKKRRECHDSNWYDYMIILMMMTMMVVVVVVLVVVVMVMMVVMVMICTHLTTCKKEGYLRFQELLNDRTKERVIVKKENKLKTFKCKDH